MKNKICGIYVIKNTVNDLCYVGQSIDILTRWIAHKNAAKNKKDSSHYVKIHQAMNNIGIDNFYLEILEECPYEKLDDREIYWIKKLDSYNNGYNMTTGGQGNTSGENNGRVILTEIQVTEIRMAYNNHVPFREVYEKYKNIISKRGLQKVWHYETWLHILPEVYTEENRKWHATYAKGKKGKDKCLSNQQRKCSDEEIKTMRQLFSQGLSYEQISKRVNRNITTIRKYCLFQESKKNPNCGTAIQVKNLETGLVFESYTAAAKWANTDRHKISKSKDNQNKTAGVVPSTGQPAHWISL